jgi:DNA-binding response OmpR family regulator
MSRVLVIDDYDDSRDALRTILEFWGHEIADAPNGADGVAMARIFRPEFAVVDLELPDMDGCEVAKALRDGDACPRLIALTGHGSPAHRTRAAEAGFDVFMLKPCDVDELKRLLDAGVAAFRRTTF